MSHSRSLTLSRCHLVAFCIKDLIAIACFKSILACCTFASLFSLLVPCLFRFPLWFSIVRENAKCKKREAFYHITYLSSCDVSSICLFLILSFSVAGMLVAAGLYWEVFMAEPQAAPPPPNARGNTYNSWSGSSVSQTQSPAGNPPSAGESERMRRARQSKFATMSDLTNE